MTIDIIIRIRKRLLRYLAWLVGSGDVKTNKVWFAIVELVGAGFGPEQDVLGFYGSQLDIWFLTDLQKPLLTDVFVEPAKVQYLEDCRSKGFG